MEMIKELIGKLKTWQKIAFVVIVVLVIASVWIFSVAKPKSEILYSDLTQNDSKSIMKELSQMGVNFTSSDGGTTILVTDENVADIRMKLAIAGLPSEGNPGLNRLEDMKLGETKYDKEKRYERAIREQIENDLVNGFDGIESATVAITINQGDRLFEESAKSKATVSLGILKGKELSPSQVKGIQNYVSANIENMEPEDVVVLDNKGNILSNGLEDGGYASTEGFSKQMKIVTETESRIKDDIMKSLTSIFGYEHVRVNVRADINFDEIVQNIEKYDPEGTLISRQENNKQIVKTDGVINIEPGTENNGDVPNYQVEDIEGDVSYLENTNDIIENFEVGKTLETIKKNPELTNLNVVTWVDKMMTQQEVEVLENAVAVAAGIRDLDGDGVFDNGVVEVIPVIFNQNVVNDPAGGDKEEVIADKNIAVWIYIFVGAGIILVALFAWLTFRKHEDVYVDEHGNLVSKDGLMTLGDIQDTNAEDDDEEGTRISEELAEKLGESKKPMDSLLFDEIELTEQQRRLSEEAKKAAEEYPERTAEYLKRLINEG